MPLYRATFIRSGSPSGLTFASSCDEKALAFWEWWQGRVEEWKNGDVLLTLRRVRSRVDNKGRWRRD